MVDANRMSRTSSTTFGPGEIVRLALDGRLRVPRFQRSYVWDERNITDLFDSIWKGFPIGTLLLWERDEPAGRLTFGSISVDAARTDRALVVVDGQQRLTTLVAGLGPASLPPDPRFEVWFDLRAGRFTHAHHKVVPEFWLPVRAALESRTLLNWLSSHQDALEPGDVDLADAMAGALRDYKVPAYVIEQDDEQLLREVFDRTNSAGKPIKRAQVGHALFGGGTDSASAAAVVDDLRHLGFGDLDEQRIIQSLLAIRGGDVARDLHGEFASNEDPSIWYDQTSEALSRVIRFLQGLGVAHVELLPSAFVIPVLASFYYLHPVPDTYTEALLARWTWRGWAHGYGRAGQTPALRQAVRSVNPAKLDPRSAPGEFQAVRALLTDVSDQMPAVVGVGFNSSSAASRLALLAIAASKPKGPNGNVLDLPALFATHGSRVVSVLARGPASELGLRALWDPNDPPLSGAEDQEVLASHVIDRQAAAALRAKDIPTLTAHRGAAIKVLVENFLVHKLEPRLPVVPPLDELWVPDPA